MELVHRKAIGIALSMSSKNKTKKLVGSALSVVLFDSIHLCLTFVFKDWLVTYALISRVYLMFLVLVKNVFQKRNTWWRFNGEIKWLNLSVGINFH